MRVEGATTANVGEKRAESPTAGLGSEAFLRLLLAQLKHQDPLKPIDSTAQIAQLAQLSSLDQAVKQTERLDGLLASSAVSQALSVIGRQVATSDGAPARALSARVDDGRVLVRLDDGREVALGSGVRVSA